jgi:YedE family putative selenium metabolism protein
MNQRAVLSTWWGITGVGILIGAGAALLQRLGNPGNMGICVACFTRDTSGALGLHRAAVVQYIRPELLGFVLGSLAAALVFRELRPRAGSAPIVRFVLGAFAVIGALVFLGCPWRALLRLAGGDGNALFGLAGLVLGIGLGTLFLRRGYTLGRASPTHLAAGLILPGLAAGLLALLLLAPPGLLWQSDRGPGAMHAPLAMSLGAGLVVGFLAQRSRFCTVGAFRDLILFRKPHLFWGVLGLTVAALIANLILGQWHPGFAGQPVAHDQWLWNLLGMVLAGLAFVLGGGCPGRQLFLGGEGDGDAAVFVLGMLAGAAFSHNLGLASSPSGVGPHGIAAVLVGLGVCVVIGLTMRERPAT